MKDLSILIPARNEMFLARTIQNILENSEADIEVIAVLDGAWAEPAIPQHDRVNVVYVPESVGQRAATNIACKLAQGKYVMKVDAHCAFDKGFDRIMLEGFAEVGDDVTMVPVMRNLWAFDWKCYTCGSRWYQGRTPVRCMRHDGRKVVANELCGETENFKRKITWKGEAKKGDTAYKNWKGTRSPANWSYCFSAEPHFQYFEHYKHRLAVRESVNTTGFTETMSLQGSCFMATRDKYIELNLCDESLGSWGNQGIEVACKTWLSGGRVLVNHKTWYAHLFRTQGGDFSFPYEQHEKHIQKTKKKTWNLFMDGWEKQIHPMSWLVERFWPVHGWTDRELSELKVAEVDSNHVKF